MYWLHTRAQAKSKGREWKHAASIHLWEERGEAGRARPKVVSLNLSYSSFAYKNSYQRFWKKIIVLYPFSHILNETTKAKIVLKSSEASRRQFDSLPAASARLALRHRTGTPAPHTIPSALASCLFSDYARSAFCRRKKRKKFVPFCFDFYGAIIENLMQND